MQISDRLYPSEDINDMVNELQLQKHWVIHGTRVFFRGAYHVSVYSACQKRVKVFQHFFLPSLQQPLHLKWINFHPCLKPKSEKKKKKLQSGQKGTVHRVSGCCPACKQQTGSLLDYLHSNKGGPWEMFFWKFTGNYLLSDFTESALRLTLDMSFGLKGVCVCVCVCVFARVCVHACVCFVCALSV